MDVDRRRCGITSTAGSHIVGQVKKRSRSNKNYGNTGDRNKIMLSIISALAFSVCTAFTFITSNIAFRGLLMAITYAYAGVVSLLNKLLLLTGRNASLRNVAGYLQYQCRCFDESFVPGVVLNWVVKKKLLSH
jgi:hypothetical protein